MLIRYRLYGETLEIASRLNAMGEPMKIQVSKETKVLLDGVGGFKTEHHGLIDTGVRKL